MSVIRDSSSHSLASPQPAIHHQAIWQMVRNRTPLSAKAFQKIRKAHLIFLRKGGGDGVFFTLNINGLVAAIYDGPDSSSGDQAVFEWQYLLPHLPTNGSILPFANFCASYAPMLCFDQAILSHSTFTDAYLSGSQFRGAQLQGVDFSRADLTGCDFTGADLHHADFEGAVLESTIFEDCLNNPMSQNKFKAVSTQC